MDVLTDRYQFDMVDVYDRVTGRNDERKTLETRVAELGVAEAEYQSAGVDGDFHMREQVRGRTASLSLTLISSFHLITIRSREREWN